MKHLNEQTWDRADHFAFFQSRENPRLNISFFASVGAWKEYRMHFSARFTDYIYYAAMLAANCVKEFRHRIVNRQPVAFDHVDAAFTYIPASRSLHCNCAAAYDANYAVFSKNIQKARDAADFAPTLTPAEGCGQNMVYLSCLKDISFYSLSNPWGDPWVDSVPRIAFGKVAPDGQMPVSVEVLHSLVDGSHLASFIDYFQSVLDTPEKHLSSCSN